MKEKIVNYLLTKQWFISIVRQRFLCWVGIHHWKVDIVMTKKKFNHCKGYEEIGHDKKAHWHDGRSCKYCDKKQYFVMNWITCSWQNVL